MGSWQLVVVVVVVVSLLCINALAADHAAVVERIFHVGCSDH